ncbi:MAG: hypothetical protein IPP94_03135 [Ignavibacteria bacterium]|nr:hypothetical protein [Ignavibacteria bacterium]
MTYRLLFPAVAILLAVAPLLPAQVKPLAARSPLHVRAGGGDALRARIATDPFARHLYAHLLGTAAGEAGATQRQTSRVALAASFAAYVGLGENGTPLSDSMRQKFFRKAELLLRGLSPMVQSNTDEWQWRAVELTQFAGAYDFLLAAGAPEDPAIDALLTSFAIQAEKRLSSVFAPGNNLTLKLAGSLGTAALALRHLEGCGDSARPAAWVARASKIIDIIVWNTQSNASGAAGYSEGPYYFRYAMLQLLPFFHALDTFAEQKLGLFDQPAPASPLRDARWIALWDWISDLRMPDGRLPAFEDTYMESRFPELAVLGSIGPKHQDYAWPMRDAAGAALDEDLLFAAMDETFDFRAEYLCAGARPADTAPIGASRVRPDAGYAVLRGSDTDGGAVFFGLIGKHGIARTHGSAIGSGHKQANETAFIFYARNSVLAQEPAYPSYDMRDAVMYSANHNVLLVDGEGPDATGYPGFLLGVDAWMEDTLSGKDFSTLSIRTRYRAANITRDAFLLGDLGILIDRASSGGEHTFTHQLHGNGLGADRTFVFDSCNGAGTWMHGNAQLTGAVAASGATSQQTAVVRSHAPAYKTIAKHHALYTSTRGGDAAFVTLLVPSAARAAPPRVTRSGDGRAWIASSITRPGEHLCVAANLTDGALTMIAAERTLTSDAKNIVRAVRGADTLLYAAGARSLSLDAETVLLSDAPVDVYLRHAGDTLAFLVDADAATDLRLPLRFEPEHVALSRGAWAMEHGVLRLAVPAGRSEGVVLLSRVLTHQVPTADMPSVSFLSPPWPQPLEPGSRHLSVHVALTRGSVLRATLVNTMGRTVAERDFGLCPAGVRQLALELPGLVPGMYLLRVESKDLILTRPVLVVR